MYESSKKYLKLKNPENQPLEYKLFHGTTKQSTDSICKFGFNRSYCGKNGTAYGQGCYFARNASYSHQYSLKDASYNLGITIPTPNNKPAKNSKLFQMIYCSVLVGAYHQTNNSTNKDTDLRPDGKQYDSTVDNCLNPTIFVVYKDYRAIPKYLIHYTSA